MRAGSRRIWGLGIAAAFLIAAGGWWVLVPTGADVVERTVTTIGPPALDPRLTFDTPFRNVKPDVRYVGDKACATCHQDIDRTYHHHPMGRSSALSIAATPIEHYNASSTNPFTALGRFAFRIERQKDRIIHHISGLDKDGNKSVGYNIEASLAIGSGARARSYLHVAEGRVCQSPITWYSEGKLWDLSPGFKSDVQFERPIVTECLFCHTSQADLVPNTLNRYREPIFRLQSNIGCERCHGPGELHVRERTDSLLSEKVDTSIVNPRHLSLGLREAICQQCHLGGEVRVLRRGREFFEFRPGLPLEAFVAVYVQPPEFSNHAKSVTHFEQMAVSKCYTASKGKMTCTTCHNPHEEPSPAAKVDFFRAQCVACHECKAPPAKTQTKANNCLACHMPETQNASVSHVALTDHRILRDPFAKTVDSMPSRRFDELPLVSFIRGPSLLDAHESERDLGLALAKFAQSIRPEERASRLDVLDMAESRLVNSLKRWPDDIAALEAMASVRHAQDLRLEELELHKRVLTLAPDREFTLSNAVEAALVAQDYPFAAECAARVIEINPFSFNYRLLRAKLRIALKQWVEAEADCRAALRLLPINPMARVMLATCLHKRGDPEGAKAELKLALSLVHDPNQERHLLNLFQSSIR